MRNNLISKISKTTVLISVGAFVLSGVSAVSALPQDDPKSAKGSIPKAGPAPKTPKAGPAPKTPKAGPVVPSHKPASVSSSPSITETETETFENPMMEEDIVNPNSSDRDLLREQRQDSSGVISSQYGDVNEMALGNTVRKAELLQQAQHLGIPGTAGMDEMALGAAVRKAELVGQAGRLGISGTAGMDDMALGAAVRKAELVGQAGRLGIPGAADMDDMALGAAVRKAELLQQVNLN